MRADARGITSERHSGAAADRGLPAAAALALAVSMGAAVPAAAFGKAVMGVVLAPAAVVVLIALAQPGLRSAVWRVATGPTGLLLALFGALSLISVLMSDHLAKSLEAWARTAAFVLFGLAATQVLARSAPARAAAQASLFAASLVALSYVVLAVYVDERALALIAWGKAEIERPATLFKGFASAVVCLVPVVLWSLTGAGLAKKALRLAVLVLAGLTIWLDGVQTSLAGILGLLAALVLIGVVAAMRRLDRRRRLGVASGLLALALVIAAAITTALPSPRENDASRLAIPAWLVDPHRQVIWAFTLEAVERRPLFGHGPNSINRIDGADQPSPIAEGDILPSHPHNWAYEIAAETGIPGLVVLCVALLMLLRRAAILAIDGSRAGWAAVALFGAFWGSSLVNFSIWAAWWQLTFIVLLAILMAGSQKEPKGAA